MVLYRTISYHTIADDKVPYIWYHISFDATMYHTPYAIRAYPPTRLFCMVSMVYGMTRYNTIRYRSTGMVWFRLIIHTRRMVSYDIVRYDILSYHMNHKVSHVYHTHMQQFTLSNQKTITLDLCTVSYDETSVDFCLPPSLTHNFFGCFALDRCSRIPLTCHAARDKACTFFAAFAFHP